MVKKPYVVIILLAILQLNCSDSGDEKITVRPNDTGEALINPDMGWILYYYSNDIDKYGSKLQPADTVDDFPGLSTVYFRVPWAFLEPEENKYDWSVIDTPAQRWIDKGKRIAIRVTCSENWMRFATPQWVKDAGAKGYEYDFKKGRINGGQSWDPDFSDPVFINKLENFLSAMAKLYDGNPNVAFIDIGSFGLWGEGHTHMSSQQPSHHKFSTLKKHIDLHLKYFKNTLLCINDDFVNGHKTVGSNPIIDYAISKGLCLRDDSILVDPAPNSSYHSEIAQHFWPRSPVILEHEHYGDSKKDGAWDDGSLLLKAAEDYHASYMSIHWWPREFLRENRELINRINERLGYRIKLKEATWPKRVRLGQNFTMTTSWSNSGVAPLYMGGYMAITLKDEEGGIILVVVDESFNMKDLKIGKNGNPPSVDLNSLFRLANIIPDNLKSPSPKIKPAIYDLYVSVGAMDGTPKISLPLPNNDGHNRYKLGRIEVVQSN